MNAPIDRGLRERARYCVGKLAPGRRDPQLASAETGSRTRNAAPRSGLFVAQRMPPWASTIVRAIESPMPRPSAFVVKNG